MILHGDCRDLMRAMDAESIDSIVSDPPYGLSFMGKGWDKGVPNEEFWIEALRVAKPGAYMLAFGGTRTYHHLAYAIEGAGWELQDCLMWLYGSGFPKHKSKLKPAYEPVILARKPAPKATLLQIDACRIGTDEMKVTRSNGEKLSENRSMTGGNYGTPVVAPATGRWPANVLLDEDAAEVLDGETGDVGGSGDGTAKIAFGLGNGIAMHGGGKGALVRTYSDKGGPSRFFYCAKSSRAEREAGTQDLPVYAGGSNAKGFTDDVAAGNDRNKPVHNFHPTVKPISLMRWLVRLVTPPGGKVLDPFVGSGTTGCAAALEGFDFVGCELDASYVAIANARIAHWSGRAA